MKIKRKKSDNNLNFIDRIINSALYVLWGFILLFCTLLLFSTKGHCASASNTEIPYIVPNWRNANSCIPDEAIQSAEIRYINDVRNYFGYSGELSYIAFVTDGLINGGTMYQIYFITNPTIPDNYIDNYDYYNGYIHVNCNNIQLIACNVRVSDFVCVGDAINLGASVDLCGHSATTTLGGGNLTPRYPFYMVGTDNILSANDKVMFTNIAPMVIPTGHATPPDEFDEPIYPTGATIPSHVPHLTINNYTWTTTPTPDFSTLESTAESIYHFLQWLGTNLMGALTNIVNNIANIGEFIGQTIQYYGNLLIKTIQNGITTFYNNMVSLFEPIATAINYIGQPLQVSEVVTAMQNTALLL